MCSPAGFSANIHWQAQMAQPSPQIVNSDGEDSGVTTKPMRLKVLYTFDDQNKTNCLARWPQILQIRTVVMDEGTSIGVIELKTCIQAIVQCSPELVAKLGQDFTVYAYDYSEYDHPLVGQGMLSWALAAASPTPNAPAHQSQQLITGRVCKNIQGLFSNGVAETLEVKLRLVPVPTVLQSEYLANMERYRELSRLTPSSSNVNEWQSFIQSNPNLAQMANNASAPSPNPMTQRDGVSLEVFNQLLSPQLQQHDSIDPFGAAIPNDFETAKTPDPAAPIGRKPTQKNSRPSLRASVKRPRKPRGKSAVNGGNTSGYEEGTDGDDGPAPKKRAKITQTDWNSKSGFGTASDSLRVAASTAGSLRAFRPIAMMQPNVGNNMSGHLQEIPRAPTPVPGKQSQILGRDRGRSQSALRRDSVASQSNDTPMRPYLSPYQMEGESYSQDLIQPSIESVMTSPEKYDSAADTPPDIGSSPPILRTATSMRSSPQIPSSPVLPQMPRTDSGFMSGDVSELFEDDEGLPPMNDDEAEIGTEHVPNDVSFVQKAPMHWKEVNPGPPELLPTKILPRLGIVKAKADPKSKSKPKVFRPRPSRVRAGSAVSDDNPMCSASNIREVVTSVPNPTPDLPSLLSRPPLSLENSQSSTVIQQSLGDLSQMQQSNHPNQATPTQAPTPPIIRPANRPMSRTASVGSLTLPTITASDPILPVPGFHRSQTWSEVPYPATDAPNPPTDVSTSKENVRGATAGTIAKKNAQRARLEEAIAKGEMPPFCKNCGAIETPTWRKGFAQDHKGDPGYHEYSDAPGRVTAIEILDKDGQGRPISYRVFKKSLLQDEDKAAFAEVLLCNPCGIWMSKYKTMRPEDKWQNDVNAPPTEKKPTEKKPRDRKPKKAQDTSATCGIDFTSEAYFQSDVFGTIDYAPPQEGPESLQPQGPLVETQGELHRTPQRQRASSLRPANTRRGLMSDAASAALTRAFQSSPARWLGTQHSPIEVEEEDMATTRRLLFPPPCRDRGPGILCETAVNISESVIGLQSPMARRKHQLAAYLNKENHPPLPLFNEFDDDIMKLFEENVGKARPITPTQKSPPQNSFKTPPRPTANHRPVTRSVSKSAKSVQTQVIPQRTPSRTPRSSGVRRSPRNHARGMESPFTATLNRLISDSNTDESQNVGNDSPSRHLDLGLDFSNLPDLGHSGTNSMNSDALNFHFPYDGSHDYFSTDVPMPSSPPRLFNVFEDPITMSMNGIETMDHLWSDFPIDERNLQAMGRGISIDASGHTSFDMGSEPPAKVKVEAVASQESTQLTECHGI